MVATLPFSSRISVIGVFVMIASPSIAGVPAARVERRVWPVMVRRRQVAGAIVTRTTKAIEECELRRRRLLDRRKIARLGDQAAVIARANRRRNGRWWWRENCLLHGASPVSMEECSQIANRSATEKFAFREHFFLDGTKKQPQKGGGGSRGDRAQKVRGGKRQRSPPRYARLESP